MKLTAIILLLSLSMQAQPGRYLKQNWPSLTCFTLAGAMDGFNEALDFDYQAFKRTFPNANDQYWNPDISWQNKWNGDRPSYFGSTTFLSWTTDGYHLTRSLNKAFLCGGVTVKICGGKQKWYMYLVDFAAHSLAYSIGFNVTLHCVFMHRW